MGGEKKLPSPLPVCSFLQRAIFRRIFVYNISHFFLHCHIFTIYICWSGWDGEE
jgi:hypothetical protein